MSTCTQFVIELYEIRVDVKISCLHVCVCLSVTIMKKSGHLKAPTFVIVMLQKKEQLRISVSRFARSILPKIAQ